MKVPPGARPKRGDLLQSNVGSSRERTWLILYAHRVNVRVHGAEDFHRWENEPRYRVWRARWWELEVDFRMKLYRSAERSGGQSLWYPAKKKHEDCRKKQRQ
jgi:hypothetical protein